MKVALGQTNSTVGDLSGNAQRMLSFARRAAAEGAQVIAFPELSLTGYPPRDLLEKESFLDQTELALEQLARDIGELDLKLICGTVTRAAESTGNRIYNSAAMLGGGRVMFRQNKMLLPSYDVFDETRYFQPAEGQAASAAERRGNRSDHLRGRLERQAVLGTPPVQPRSGGRARSGPARKC